MTKLLNTLKARYNKTAEKIARKLAPAFFEKFDKLTEHDNIEVHNMDELCWKIDNRQPLVADMLTEYDKLGKKVRLFVGKIKVVY